jgi:hypothetical protein
VTSTSSTPSLATHITSHHITSYHIISYHITSHRVVSHHITFLLGASYSAVVTISVSARSKITSNITSYHVILNHIILNHIKSPVLSSPQATCRMALVPPSAPSHSSSERIQHYHRTRSLLPHTLLPLPCPLTAIH